MTRTVDLVHRESVLDRVTAYVLEKGLGDLSLRPLADAVGVSPRTLLYHFGSKEALTARVLQRLRDRQRAFFERLRGSECNDPAAICKAVWSYVSAPDVLPYAKLFFETYALALREPLRFPGFLEGAVEDWLEFLSAPLLRAGADAVHARAHATIVLAGYRGFLLDLIATNDRKRLSAALDLWIDSLAALYEDKDGSHAQQA